MSSIKLLVTCLALILGSIFVAPGSISWGVNPSTAMALSSTMMFAGILSAILTIKSENEDKKRYHERP